MDEIAVNVNSELVKKFLVTVIFIFVDDSFDI